MLRHTFKIFPGVGTRLERHLWHEGISVWEDFLSKKKVRGISQDRKEKLNREISAALQALEKGNPGYFAERLNDTEHWRLFEAFRNETVCLDIETTGGQPAEGAVTMVGIYGNGAMQTLIQGINLDPKILSEILSSYKLVITYFGRVFDLPFLQKSMPGIHIRMPHFDLCPASHCLGIKGGLKKLEKFFGISREDSLDGMNGYDAVILWHKYQAGNAEALDLLKKYNEADTKNLYLLAEILYGMLCRKYGPGIN